jgi:hypothetical protein
VSGQLLPRASLGITVIEIPHRDWDSNLDLFCFLLIGVFLFLFLLLVFIARTGPRSFTRLGFCSSQHAFVN